MDFSSAADIHASVAAYISASAPVLLLVLTCDGTIVYANRHAGNTFAMDLAGCSIDDIVIDFNGSFDLKTLVTAGEEQLLSLGNGSQLPQSFLCSFRETGSGLIVLCGHADQAETKELQRELLELNQEINNRNRELHKAIATIKTLSGLLPICSHCRKIREDTGYWTQIEEYIRQHTDADFSHSICPACAKEHYPDLELYKDS